MSDIWGNADHANYGNVWALYDRGGRHYQWKLVMGTERVKLDEQTERDFKHVDERLGWPRCCHEALTRIRAKLEEATSALNSIANNDTFSAGGEYVQIARRALK